MDRTTRDAIIDAVPRLRSELYSNIARADLKPQLQAAMNIMDVLQDFAGTHEILTAPWIAEEVGLDAESTRQILRALKAGGLNLKIIQGKGLQVVERPYPWTIN